MIFIFLSFQLNSFLEFFFVYVSNKVHRNRGRTLFIVSVEVSKNKLASLRSKKYLFIFALCSLSDPIVNQLFVFILKTKYRIAFYVPCSPPYLSDNENSYFSLEI